VRARPRRSDEGADLVRVLLAGRALDAEETSTPARA
jgi:hypothetical protein